MSEMNLYLELHILFNSLPRHNLPYEKGDKNGIYVMFEKGERYKGMDRIVRVGSHTGKDRLFERINEHFLKPNQRQSIFRRHIGRSLLCMEGKEYYLPIWDCDIKSRVDKERNYNLVDWTLEKVLEGRITEYLQERFSFVIVSGLTDGEKRKRLEAAIIATLAQSPERRYSSKWLGRWHYNDKIAASKLWNINHLKGVQLTPEELIELSEMCIELKGTSNQNDDGQ